MNETALFKAFDQFTDTADGLSKLRGLILRLAVQGQLAKQSLDDESTEQLLVEIGEDRSRYVVEHPVGRQRVMPPVSNDEYPFDTPPGWVWTRLGNLCRVQPGFAFRSEGFVNGSSGMPIIRIRDITNDRTQVNYVGEYREDFLVEPGDYLVGMDGNFTVSKWRGPRALLNQRVSRLLWYSRKIEPAFLAVAAQHRLTELQGTKAYTTVDHLSSGQIENVIVPLPPTAEQKRIVAKVDELMALCDRLEAQQKERETRHAALARASLSRFADVPTPENLALLFHKSYEMAPADLRKAILGLAFTGRLVSQNPHEEPGPILLARARAEKTRRIEEGTLKGEPWSGNVHPAKALYDVPSNWGWAYVSDVVEKVTVGFVGSMKEQYRERGVPFLRSQNVRMNRFEPQGLTFISENFHRSIAKSALRPGDVVVTRSGNVGVTCVIPENLAEANCSDLVVVKKPLAIVPAFLSFFINSIASGQVEAKTVGIALTHFNTQSVAHMIVPLPPLAEQRRIVARVDQLMSLVDQLEAQVAASRSTASRLLEAIVAELTA